MEKLNKLRTMADYLSLSDAKSQGMTQMMKAEGVTEELTRTDQMEWILSVNNIINRVEEIIKAELIYC